MMESINPQEIMKQLGNLTITKDNKNVMRPDVMNFLLLAAIASQATKIRKNLEDKTSVGWVKTWTVNVDTTEPSKEYVVGIGSPGQSIALVNNGPNPVVIEINYRTNGTPVAVGQPYSVSFDGHKLNRFYLRCPVGVTSVVVTVKG